MFFSRFLLATSKVFWGFDGLCQTGKKFKIILKEKFTPCDNFELWADKVLLIVGVKYGENLGLRGVERWFVGVLLVGCRRVKNSRLSYWIILKLYKSSRLSQILERSCYL